MFAVFFNILKIFNLDILFFCLLTNTTIIEEKKKKKQNYTKFCTTRTKKEKTMFKFKHKLLSSVQLIILIIKKANKKNILNKKQKLVQMRNKNCKLNK